MRILGRFTLAILLLAGLWATAGAQQVWTLRNPLTQGKTINAVVWTGTQFVAVGIDGVIITSDDGLTWQNRTSSAVTVTLYAVTYANNRLFAVGGGGRVYVSLNGIDWTNVSPSITTQPLYGVSSLNGRIVAVGGGNTLIYSDNNGTSWTQATSPLAGTTAFVGIAASSTKLVALSGATAVQSTDGITWTSASTGNGGLTAVTWAVNQFVVTGAVTVSGVTTGLIRTSPDGNAPWTNRTSNASVQLSSVAFGSQLVAVGAGGAIRYSANGEGWTAATSPTTVNLNGVAASNTRFVAVGVNGMMLASSDGINWTQTSSITAGLNSMASRITTVPAETLDVIVGAGGTVLTSTTGTTWTKRSFPSANELKAVSPTSTGFVALASRDAYISTDGITWTTRPTNALNDLNGLATNGATAVAVGRNTEIVVSTNGGANWTAAGNPQAEAERHLMAVAYGGTPTAYWVAVGTGGLVRRAGGTGPGGGWSALGIPNSTTPSAERFDAVIWAGSPHNVFVAVGTRGVVFTSPNGQTWTSRPTGFSTNLYSIAYTGSQFVATGVGGHVITSPDLDAWTLQTPGTAQALYNVKWDGRLVIATGAGGTIVTSSPSAIPPVPPPGYPLAGAVNVPLNPTFSWTGTSGAVSYRVQVSASSTFATLLLDSVQAVAKGTTLTFGELAPSTQYYWRVSTVGGTGSSDFSATQGFTTIAAGSSAPVLDTPAMDATDVPLSTALSWVAYAGAVSYRVQVSTDSTFVNPTAMFAENLSLSGSSMLLNGLAANTKYFWRVSARLNTGITGWSWRRFRTTPPAPTAPPLLLTPADGAIGVSRTAASLTWSSVSGASFYQVQLSTTSSFSAIVRDTNVVGGTSLLVSGLAENGVYYWRVKARNAAGASDFSLTRMFTTSVSAPAAPVLVSPSQSATSVDVFTTFTWNASAGAASYRLLVATDTAFNSKVVDSTLTGTSVTLKTKLGNMTAYHWRVSATNPAGTGTSLRRTFTTGNAPTTVPPAPELDSPVQFANEVNPASVALTWKAAATARGYVLQVSTSGENFDAQILVNDSVSALTRTVTSLTGATSYFWRVKAYNHLGFGPSSEVWNFNTRATLPPPPVLVSPVQYALEVSVLPTLFTWRKAHSATSYVLHVSTVPEFTSYVLNMTGVSDTAVAVTSLAQNTEYYWRVLSRNAVGTGNASGTHYFKTGVIPLPGTVTLVAPDSFATAVPVSTNLIWAAASNASTYHLQVSVNQSFNSFLLRDSTLTVLTRAVTNLPQSTNIYWRVRAKNVTGTGAWSTRMFVTDGPSGIVPGQVAFERLASANGQALRFGLWRKDAVRIRFFDTQGRQVAARIEKTLDPGYHVLLLPEHLRGSFYLLDFQAGDYRKTVKIHPGK